jgi:hypothetical protein
MDFIAGFVVTFVGVCLGCLLGYRAIRFYDMKTYEKKEDKDGNVADAKLFNKSEED